MTDALRWTCELDGWIDCRPVVAGAQIFVRSGGAMTAVGTESGTVSWSTPIDPANNTGQFLVLSDSTLITSRNVADRTVLVATDLAGDVQWELETGVIVLDAHAVADGELLVYGGSGGDYVFHRIVCATGEIVERGNVPWLPDRIALVGERWLGARRAEPGLVALDEHGHPTHHLVDDPVYGLAALDTGCVMVPMVDDRPRIERRSSDLEIRWQQPAATTDFGADASAVVGVARSTPSGVEALDADSGQTLWTSRALADEPVQFCLLDSVVEARGLTMLWVLDRRDGSIIGEQLMGSSIVDSGSDGYVVSAMKALHHYENPTG